MTLTSSAWIVLLGSSYQDCCLQDLTIAELGDLTIGELGDLTIGELGDLTICELGDLTIGELDDLTIGELCDQRTSFQTNMATRQGEDRKCDAVDTIYFREDQVQPI